MTSLSFHILKLIIASTMFGEVMGNETTYADFSGNSYPCPYNQIPTTKICEVCPNGTFGWNCKQKCQLGYFGELCLSVCNCSNHTCNHIYGCSDSEVTTTNITYLTNDVSDEVKNNKNLTLIHKNSTAKDSEQNISHSWIFVNFCVIGLLCAVIIIGILAFIRSWVLKRTFETGAMTEIINRNDEQRLNAQGPGFQSSNVDSTYAELRYSKMIENNHVMQGQTTFSEKNTSNVMKTQEGAFGGVNFLKEAEEKCDNNDYEYCSSENGYSFLSLKVYRSKRHFKRPTSNIFKREKSPPTTFSTEEQYVFLKDKGNDVRFVNRDCLENDNLLAQNRLQNKSCLERYSFVQNTFCKKGDTSVSKDNIPEKSGEINNLNQSMNTNDHTYEDRNPTNDTITPKSLIYSNAYLMDFEVEHTDISVSMVNIPDESGEINNLNQSINTNDHTYEERNPNNNTNAPRTRIYSTDYLMDCEVEHTDTSASVFNIPDESGEINNLSQSINTNDHTYEDRNPTNDTTAPKTRNYSTAYLMDCEVEHTDTSVPMVNIHVPDLSGEERNPTIDTIAPKTCIYSNAYLMDCEVEHTDTSVPMINIPDESGERKKPDQRHNCTENMYL